MIMKEMVTMGILDMIEDGGGMRKEKNRREKMHEKEGE